MKRNKGKKFNSFEKMENEKIRYFLSMTPRQRLDVLSFLRESYFKIKNIKMKKLDKTITKKQIVFK